VPKARPNPKPAPAAPRPRHDLWICLGLLAVIFAVYAQVAHFDFVNFDDPEYVLRNAHVRGGVTPGGLAWAFGSGYGANWFPLTWISHMLDVQLFGMDAGFHHLTNVLLHALASLLLFAFLRRATRALVPSAFVAFLFALHPLHVESVAWVAERKDVLSAVFWFLALWAYVRYTERPSAARYLQTLAAFALGLMAKPMIVTLPFVLLLLDAWPLGRLRPSWPRIREKLPFFALSAAVSLVTYEVQRAGGAVMTVSAIPLMLRIENALVSYVDYILKMLWPAGLAVFYPYPLSVPAWQVAAAALTIAAITFLAVRAFSARPYLTVGWLWYLGTLLPVIGLVQVGTQARADRYMYVPAIGLAIMLAWSIASFGNRAAMAMAAACAAWAALTWVQLGYWRNSETLFRHALAVTRDNAIAEHNLGSALLDEPGRLPEAIAHLRAALRINPGSAQAHTDLGSALAKAGRPGEAIAEFRAALAGAPGSAVVHNNLANALAASGQPLEAIREYDAALRIDPAYNEARQNLAIAHFDAGVSFAKAGRAPEAVAEFQEALRLLPGYADAHNNLGVVLSQMPGRLNEAISHFEAAVRLRPDYEDAKFNLEAARSEKQKH
jgi:protein O-mannosyl-transferase